jgi:hypothetical protein
MVMGTTLCVQIVVVVACALFPFSRKCPHNNHTPTSQSKYENEHVKTLFATACGFLDFIISLHNTHFRLSHSFLFYFIVGRFNKKNYKKKKPLESLFMTTPRQYPRQSKEKEVKEEKSPTNHFMAI